MKKNNFYSGGFAPIWILLVTALSGLATFGGKIAADTFNKLTGTNQQTEQELRNSLLYLNKEKLLGAKIEGSLTGTVILNDGSYSGYKINKADIEVTPKTNNDTFYKGNAEIEFSSKDIGTGNYSDNRINPFYLKDGTTTQATIVDKMSASLLTKNGQNIPIRILTGKARNGVLIGDFQAQTYSSGYILAGTLDDLGNVSAITILSGGKKLAEGPTLIAPKVLDLFKEFKTEDQSKVLAATDPNPNLSFQEGMPIIENPSKGTFFPPTGANVIINNTVQGPVGPQGPPGTNGIDGIDGINGINGTNGSNGAAGPQGPAGTDGTSGSTTWGAITGTVSNQTDLNNTLNSKEPTITSGTTSQYWRGDKTFQTLDKNAVGLGNVENTVLSTWPGSTNITTLGTINNLNATNISVGGTVTVTNIPLGTGTTGIFIDSSGILSKRVFGTLAFDSSTYDNYNHWKLQNNGTGTTNILSGNTVNFVNGVGISLAQTGSTITINNVGAGTTYGAGSGLNLSSNVFSLDLGSTNTWLAPQTFGNLTIGGTFVSVGSTNLVTNLNANYLNGIASSGFIGIGQTGNLPYVNNTNDTTLTRFGTGPHTLALNLGSTNTWTALQTFNNVNIGGTLNLTGINIGTGTTGLFIDSTGLITKRLFGTLAFDSSTYDNYNHWKLQNNGTGTTNILSGNTVNFVNGVGISIAQSGSALTINNTGVLGATNGLSMIGTNVGLGGTLSQNTNIGTSSFGFSFLGLGNTQALFIGSSGNIGIGTSTPNAKLNVLGNLQIGTGAGTTTPSFMILDNGTSEPAGTNGAMYYNSSLNKMRCFENGAWKNCITNPGSDLQHAATYPADETTTAISAATTTIATVSITPSTDTGDIYVRGAINVISGSAADQNLVITLRNGTCAGGTLIGTNTINITSVANTIIGNFEIAGIIVDAGALAHTLSLCASTATGTTNLRLIEIIANVIDTGADLAEVYTTNDTNLEPGDVVAYDSNLKTGMKKSEKAYDTNAFGIVTTKPGLVIGSVDNEGVKALPVALSGRVPVKVSTENGIIKTGDFLTSSSIPGVAMKATKSGYVLGQAITSYEGTEIGTVLVFIKNTYFQGIDLSQITTITPVSTPSIDLTVLGQLISKGGLIVEEKAEFKNKVSFEDQVTFNKDTAGTAIIKKDSDRVQIDFEKEYEQTPAINISMETDNADNIAQIFGENYQYVTTNKNSKGFTIIINKKAKEDITFSWTAIAAKDAKTFYSQVTPAPTPTPVEQIAPTDIPTPTISPTPPPTIIPTPTLEPTIIPTISPEPTPTETATDSAKLSENI